MCTNTESTSRQLPSLEIECLVNCLDIVAPNSRTESLYLLVHLENTKGIVHLCENVVDVVQSLLASLCVEQRTLSVRNGFRWEIFKCGTELAAICADGDCRLSRALRAQMITGKVVR